jgi:hypothetical protein
LNKIIDKGIGYPEDNMWVVALESFKRWMEKLLDYFNQR